MRLAVALLSIALLSFVTAANAVSLDKRISNVEKQLELVRGALRNLRMQDSELPHDVRGRGKLQDVERWAYTPDLDQKVLALLAEASGSDHAHAEVSVSQASRLLEDAMSRALEIAKYWDVHDVVTWRTRWRIFATANEIGQDPDAVLVNFEKSMFEQLDRGDFAAATQTGQQLKMQLEAFINAALSRRAKSVDPASLKWVQRTTPCPRDAESRMAGTEPGKARVTRAASPNNYYPPASKRRGEQGDVVVRARVSASGCATAIAVVVSTGYPELDSAGVQVAEYSIYSPATEDGKPVETDVTFKVRFWLSGY